MQIFEICLFCTVQILFFIIIKNKFYDTKLAKLLIDKPGYNKIHTIPVPQVGGLCIYFSILNYVILGLYFEELKLINQKLTILLFGASFAFLIGLIDDLIQIKPEKKLILILIFNIVFFQNLDFFQIKVLTFSSYIFFFEINIFSISLTLSILSFLACHYALVIMDGINGIFGTYIISLLIIILIFFEISYPFKNFIFYSIIILTFVTILNIKNYLFFGNSGSLIFAAIIPYIFLLIYNERTNQIFLFNFISLIIIPVLDMLRLFFKRLINKRNPFGKDLNHLHHKLLKKFNLNLTLLIYIGICFIPFCSIEIFKLDPFTILLLQIISYFALNKFLTLKS